MAFPDNLRRLRLERFVSQGALARRAGLHAGPMPRLEAGTTAPATRTVRALADSLGVEPRELATPDEVAELRRVLKDAAQVQPRASYHLDTWDDDGGAVQAEAGGHADRASSRADDQR